MKTGPLSMQPIADRLVAEVPSFELIGRAADLEKALTSRSPVTPAAYVVLGSESPSARVGTTQRLVQSVTATWSVVIAIRDYSLVEQNAATQNSVHKEVEKIRLALLRWRHPDAEMETQLGGRAQTIKFANGVLWWEDVYSAVYQVRV